MHGTTKVYIGAIFTFVDEFQQHFPQTSTFRNNGAEEMLCSEPKLFKIQNQVS